MNDGLRARFAELRDEERGATPAFAAGGGTPPGQPARRRRSAVAFALLLLIVIFFSKRHTTFTPEDRAAARAIAAWHPPTDFLLRMPSTGVPR